MIPPDSGSWHGTAARGSADRALEQVDDVPLKDRVCLEADGVLVTFGFEELVEVGQRKRGIAPEEAPLHLVPVADEHEEWMVAGAGEVAVVGSALLIAMGRADAAVHVEHDCLGRMLRMHKVDPLP